MGASAGFAPGPLTALVISETLRYNMRAGIRAAISPLVTDFPIILFSLLILSRISSFHGVLGGISLVGALVLMHMGYESFRTNGRDLDASSDVVSASLKKGIVVNLTNPQPYLFWISVGAPTFLKALDNNLLSALLFIIGFYFFLVGAKVLTALLVGKFRHFFAGKVYVWIMRFLGLFLFVFAGILLHDAFTLFINV